MNNRPLETLELELPGQQQQVALAPGGLRLRAIVRLSRGGVVSFTANQEPPTDLREYPRIMGVQNQGSAMINELLTKS